MKKRKKGKVRWLSVLLAGCLLLSIIPATAFAAEDTAPTKSENAAGEESQMPEQQNATEESTSEHVTGRTAEAENKDAKADTSSEKSSEEISTYAAGEYNFLPEGVKLNQSRIQRSQYTQVNVTANVSIKDSDGTVVETTQVSKSSGDFIKGDFEDEAVETALANLQTEIEASYKARGTITSKDGKGKKRFCKFEDEIRYTFTPTSGDPVDLGSEELEAAKQYFSEHPDATGTLTEATYVYEYEKYNYTYDLIVQENSQPTSTITSAAVQNVKFDYQPGDAPQATAWVAVDDMDKYEIAYECWQQFENNEPVAAWYSDNGSHGSLPTITEFESGKEYVYFVMLKPKDGYSFSSETTVTVNWESVKSSLSGEFLYVPAVKTITIPTIKVIDVVEVNDVTVSFKDGDKPVFTGKVPEGAGYAFRYEWWKILP